MRIWNGADCHASRNSIVRWSSGNLGIALSLVCAIKGYKFICVTDSTATRANIRGWKHGGSLVVNERDADGGFLANRFKIISRILQSEPNAVWLNQYDNIANKNVHATRRQMRLPTNSKKWIGFRGGRNHRHARRNF